MHCFIKNDRTNQNYFLKNNQVFDDYFKNNNILEKLYKDEDYGEIFLININITTDNLVIFYYFLKFNPHNNGASFRYIENLDELDEVNKENFVLNLFDEFYIKQYDSKYCYIFEKQYNESNYFEIKEKYPNYFLEYEYNNMKLIRFSDEIKRNSIHFLKKSNIKKTIYNEKCDNINIEYINFTINDDFKLQINNFLQNINFEKYINFNPHHISLIIDNENNIIIIRFSFVTYLNLMYLPIINNNILETMQNYFNNYDNTKYLTISKNIYDILNNDDIIDGYELEVENKVIIKIPNNINLFEKIIYELK